MYVCVKQGIVACISTAECLDTERVFLSFLYQSVRSVTSSSVLLKLLPGPTGSTLCAHKPKQHLDIPNCTTDLLHGKSPVIQTRNSSPAF